MKKLLLLFTGLVSLFMACVEPFDLDYSYNKRLLIVDGILTDSPTKDQRIILRESIPNEKDVFFSQVTGAVVTVIKNDNERFTFLEESPGVYVKPAALKIEEQVPYSLEMVLKDGRKYRSKQESYKSALPIKEVYAKLELSGLELGTNGDFIPAHYIYVDAQDKPGKGNNYVWDWRLYERQFICASCENGRYFIDRRTGKGICRDESTPLQTEIFYNDYFCDKPCWEVYFNDKVNALSDNFIDGQSINGRLVAKIPIYQSIGALIQVSQKSVSPGAFRYLKLIIEQSQNVGSLADTPPAALLSNVKNESDPQETVGGYFTVASESVKNYWLDREDAKGLGLKSLGLLGRPISPEVSESTDRPPLAPCEASRTRTPLIPDGWRN